MKRINRNLMIGGGAVALTSLGLLLPLADPPNIPSDHDVATLTQPGPLSTQAAKPRRSSKPSAQAEASEDVGEEAAWDWAQEVEEAVADLGPIFPDTPLGRDLQAHVDGLEALGPDAQSHYWETLEMLRANPAEATDLLEAAYQGLPEGQYLDRWKLVDTLAALEDAVALDALVRIAADAIPEERYPDRAEFSSHSEETMIRAAAIDGLRRLAQDGVSGAEQALIDVVADADAGARLAAVVAYRSLGAGEAGDLSALEAALSPADQWMLEVEVAGAPPASAYTRPIDAEDPSRPHEAGDADDPDEWDDLPPLGDPEVHPTPSGAMDAMPQSAHAKHRRAQ